MGHTKHEGQYVDGRPHGHWVFRYDDGTLMQECDYDHGSPVGRWETYWANGNRQSEGHYSQSRKQGLWMRRHDNGQLKSRGHYTDGREDGVWHYWNERGELRCEGAWHNGFREGRWRFNIDDPEHTFQTEWYQGEMTNRPGQPPDQPREEKATYYAMVAGQLPGFETPFHRPGQAADVYFACLRSGRRFSYLFHPVAPFTHHEAAGLFLSIWERYAMLFILEKVFTAAPDTPLPTVPNSLRSRKKDGHVFLVMLDPLQQSSSRFPASRCTTMGGALKSAQRLAQKQNAHAVVGRFVREYPLDF